VTPPAAAAAPAVRPAPRRAPRTQPQPRPRRVSGPARPVKRPGAPRPGAAAQADTGLALGVLAALRGVSRHRLLDRLIAGRTWIALLAFALIGIVTLQLGLLELNSGIGRALERTALLQRENASLSIEDSELAAGERVESRAARLGMELVPTGALRFLTARPGTDALHAAAALSAPKLTSTPTSTGTSTVEATVGAGESSAAAAGAEAASSQQPASQSAATPTGEAGSSGQAGNTAGEATAPSANATPAPTASPSAAAQAQTPSSAGPVAAGSAEASPAGGTQAGSSG
jgi:hypothetical protein